MSPPSTEMRIGLNEELSIGKSQLRGNTHSLQMVQMELRLPSVVLFAVSLGFVITASLRAHSGSWTHRPGEAGSRAATCHQRVGKHFRLRNNLMSIFICFDNRINISAIDRK